MKKTRVVGAVLAGIALLSLSALPAPAADPPGFETYVVRRGDTLSKIAGRVFGDVKRWREILKANPQVTNANLIFPGDALLVPIAVTAAPTGPASGLMARPGAETAAGAAGLGTASSAGAAIEKSAGTGGPGAGKAAGGTVTGSGAGSATGIETSALPVVTVQPRPRPFISPGLVSSAGFFVDTLPRLAIIAAEDDRLIIASEDAAIVDAPVSPGTIFAVVHADRRVFHPRTGVCLGWLIRVLGTAEVTCRDERTSTIELHRMRDAGGIGDYLMPIEPGPPAQIVLAEKAVPACVPPGPADGMIVAFNEDKLISGEMELAYIDRGTASCVAPGRVYTIYRESYPEGSVAVGELQVLRSGERTAAALITTSFKEVQIGDLLRAR